MSTSITSGSWWKDALIRAVRTAILIAVPYLGGSLLAAVPWVTIASAAGLGFVASLITSLVGLPDANSQPWWLATLTRVTKTVAQSIATGIANIVFFQDVHWSVVLQASAIAGLGSLLLAVLADLPEAVPPTQAVVVSSVTGSIPVQHSAGTYVNISSGSNTLGTNPPAEPEPEATVTPAVPNIQA